MPSHYPLVIGLGHRARNGKDTVARFIYEKYGKQNGGPYDIAIRPFAACLKDEVNQAAALCGGMLGLFTALAQGQIAGAPPLPRWVEFDPDPDMTDPLCPLGKQRFLLMWWGTEFRRQTTDQNYWVKKMDAYLKQTRAQVVLIPDTRFKNEFFMVKAIGGETLKVVRTGYSDPQASSANHSSENDLLSAKWDATIECGDGPNEGLPELQRLAYEYFDQVIEDYMRVPSSPLFKATYVHATGEPVHA